MMNNFDNRYGRDDHISTRDGFQTDGFGSDIYNSYYSSSQPSRRYKREKHNENSGHRSQYNPNKSIHENDKDDEKNSSDNNSSKEDDSKACALHCFLENLKMTDDEGKPDKYLVTHAITKEVRNEDLKDFLQEAVEECFQMLENENTDEKCEFSKNLLMCLSEKGRANCDDWKDDLRF
uniref:Odorant Binding Protein 49 n=1 Tax=Dendrolimus punctatus TaxID=238572 RepID=A0A2K8GKP5_9NEOP|nr:Odorant Binding Protein 49 [Dendrolimus punctatus]